jgi:hypothetical protein
MTVAPAAEQGGPGRLHRLAGDGDGDGAVDDVGGELACGQDLPLGVAPQVHAEGGVEHVAVDHGRVLVGGRFPERDRDGRPPVRHGQQRGAGQPAVRREVVRGGHGQVVPVLGEVGPDREPVALAGGQRARGGLVHAIAIWSSAQKLISSSALCECGGPPAGKVRPVASVQLVTQHPGQQFVLVAPVVRLAAEIAPGNCAGIARARPMRDSSVLHSAPPSGRWTEKSAFRFRDA